MLIDESFTKILGKNGFVLRKWYSNIRSLNREGLALNKSDGEPYTRTTGLHWKPANDYFGLLNISEDIHHKKEDNFESLNKSSI